MLTLVGAGAILGLTGLAGCAKQETTAVETADARLFTRGLDEIADLYIEPVSPRRVAVAGAARLSALDPKLRAGAGPEAGDQATLSLSYDDRPIGSYGMPSGNDSRELGAILATAISSARQVSATIAALPESTVDKAVFDGMTGALDRFSRYASPDAARELRAARNGFGGIGVTLDPSNDDFRITALTSGSPAERAGIRPGDRLVAINGVATAGHSRAAVTQMLRGPVSSMIAVTAHRPELDQNREYQLRRALVTFPTVTVARTGKIVIFRVAGFNQSTTQRIAEGLATAREKAGDPVAGIVLDLRGNPGGLLEQAVSLADLFIPRGPIISTVGRHPAARQYFGATGKSIAPHTPIVVLINGGSASASEIVAAALQDTGRAVVVGSSSYGKGSVQTVLRLPNDGELTLTWARLVTPSGNQIQAHGVVPTLCTSDLGDDDRAIDIAVQRAKQAPPAAAKPAGARANRDERAWADLRQSCPPRHTSPPVDLKVAERLLGDPALYSQVLRPSGGSTNVARPGPTGPSLTGAAGTLSSRSRQN